MQLLAHRGYWEKTEEKNSVLAIRRAFECGYGIETDIRDHQGGLVISHDIPEGDNLLSFDDFLSLYRETGSSGMLALNVKADGLQLKAKETLNRHGIPAAQYFFFDMSVPDALGYLKHALPCYTRYSDVEQEACFLEQARGVWIDAFHSDWIDETALRLFLCQGKEVALVSPELHARKHRGVWKEWSGVFSALEKEGFSDKLMLCTDFPSEAEEYFRG